MDLQTAGPLLWEPASDARLHTRLGAFFDRIETRYSVSLNNHEAGWLWSIEHLDLLWAEIVDEFDIHFHQQPSAVLAHRAMPGAIWFPGATLNYAEHVLAMPGASEHDTAVWSLSQTRDPVVTTLGELRQQVSACRNGLQQLGVTCGDRVAAYLPNVIETLVSFLATASLGAVWSSCPPEFGVRSVLDRFRQIEPAVLIAVDGYRYGDNIVDRRRQVEEIRAGLPSLRQTVMVPYLEPDGASADGARTVTWSSLSDVGQVGPVKCTPVPFDHPLYVLYSSGTTGLPKPIVHGHGGITVEHAKQLGLYGNLGPGDRFFWFSTTGWMMWNFLVSGPMVGASIVMFDGDPQFPGIETLWSMAGDLGITYFGTSAPFVMASRKAGVRPGDLADLSKLRSVGSTGAPLPADGFHWVYDAVKDDVLLSSASGGTDVCSAFVGGSPLTPVRAGEISCRYLGCAVSSFDPDGHPLLGTQGELVITEPMPSMPVGFWGDDDGSAYRAAYFKQFPGIWRHGDWITIHDDGTCVISGRSDSTLNRGGVRLGTSDFYAAVEELPEVADSLVVHLDGDGEEAGELILFVALVPGAYLDHALRIHIRAVLRTQLSPRHVPDRICAVPSVPRTLSGKKLEVPVKLVLMGTPVHEAVSLDALADPRSFAAFHAFAKERGAIRPD